MPIPIYLVVTAGLVGTIVALVLAIRRKRTPPTHRVPWIIALAALGVDSVFHLAISVGSLMAGGWESMWIVIGSIAIAGVFAIAWVSPQIAGWWLIATAIGLPMILAAATTAAPPTVEQPVPLSVLLTFYTPRMIIVGGLLIWSSLPRRTQHVTGPEARHGHLPSG